MRRLPELAFALVGLLGAACGREPAIRSGALTAADRVAIRALDSSFVSAWLRDDTSAVLRTFDRYAVLMPPGAFPIVGIPEIRDYWFPNDGTHTRITSFERTITEIEGTRQLAFVRGTARLGWLFTKGGKTSALASRASDLLIVAPDSAGSWHVIRQMWGVLPE